MPKAGGSLFHAGIARAIARTTFTPVPRMNIPSWLRACILVLALSSGAGLSARAADDFKIVAVRPFWSADLIYVGKAWRKDLPKRILASLRVEADTPASSIFVKAYFYDKDDKLVGSSGAPNKIWTQTSRGIEEVGLPATLPRVKTTDVYFAIPPGTGREKGGPPCSSSSATPAKLRRTPIRPRRCPSSTFRRRRR